VPKKRDDGMSEDEARSLASTVRGAGVERVQVEPDGIHFVVTAVTTSGRYTLHDGDDWAWLRNRILGA
jgi:hypothetical protein